MAYFSVNTYVSGNRATICSFKLSSKKEFNHEVIIVVNKCFLFNTDILQKDCRQTKI